MFSGQAALDATGASAGDLEARLLAEGQLQEEAAQVRLPPDGLASEGACCVHMHASCAWLHGPVVRVHQTVCARAASPACAFPRPGPQTFALVREYEAAHALDTAAQRRAAASPLRRELVQAAQHLAAGLGLGGAAQLWHAGGCSCMPVLTQSCLFAAPAAAE